MESFLSVTATALTLAALVTASPQTATTTANLYATAPTACPSRGSAFYYLQARGTGTTADGTYLTGVNYEPDYLAVFNPAESNGYGPQLTIQAYEFDFYTQSWFDGLYHLCINYSAINTHQVATCSLTEYNNGKTGALVCNSNFFDTNNVTCTVAGPGNNGTIYDTLYIDVQQVLAIGTADDAQAAGTKLTLTPESAHCS